MYRLWTFKYWCKLIICVGNTKRGTTIIDDIFSLLIEALQLSAHVIFHMILVIGAELIMVSLFVQNFKLLWRRQGCKPPYNSRWFGSDSISILIYLTNNNSSYCVCKYLKVLISNEFIFNDMSYNNYLYLIHLCLIGMFSLYLTS